MATETMQGTLEQPLTAQDRCDRCGAQAYMRATVSGTELHFCAHHGREHEPKLRAAGASIYSESEKLSG